jgi:hypothetical protein
METTPTSMIKSENTTDSDHQSETSNGIAIFLYGQFDIFQPK